MTPITGGHRTAAKPGLRVLTIDIETSPAEVYVFDLFKQNISIGQIKEPTRVISFTAKWLGEDAKFYGEDELTHRELIEKAFELLSEADAVVTYNGDRFDIPHLNREFTELGLGRPQPFHSIDLYKVVKKHHKFLSNKLAWITERLELSGKKENSGWPLWIGCLNGEAWAWAEMRAYNLQDVVTTEELYLELLVWIDNHPNVQLYRDEPLDRPGCPRCESPRVVKQGFKTTKVGKFQQYQCLNCGSWSTSGKRVEGTDLR